MNWSSEQPLLDNVESDSMTFSCGNMNISLDRNSFKATGFSEYKRDNSPGSSLEILDIRHHPDHSNMIQNYQKEIQDLKFKLQQSQNREQGLRILFDKHQRQQVEEMSFESERKSLCHLEIESNSKVISCEDEQHEICEEDFEKKQHNIQKLEQIIHQLTSKIKDLQSENVILKHQISAIHEDFMKERHDKKVLEKRLQKLPLKRSPSYLLDCNLPSNVEPDGV